MLLNRASIRSMRPVRSRSRSGALVAVAFALSTLGVFAWPGQVFGWDANSFSPADESELITLTNQARASNGLPALKVDSALTSIARWRSKDMIVRNYFDHAILKPPGGTVFNEMDRRGYCYSLAGENIGWNNYPDNVATEEIQQMFMASPGHRANILGSRWDHIGVGAYKGSTGKKMWTVLFADKCGSAPAPKPTPKPTPRPTPRATPRPTPKPTPKATPRATPKPAPRATATPDTVGTATVGSLTLSEPTTAPTRAPTEGPSAGSTIGATGGAGSALGLRIADAPAPTGLFEAIVGGVAGLFFGT